LLTLITQLGEEFPEIVLPQIIGKSYYEVNIPMMKMTATRDQSSNVTSILVTGAHHARELTSISMNMYLALRLIYDYVKKDSYAVRLLENHIIYFIPVVNIDGF
jgi:murein tripeptide amidase MpaA